MTFEKKYKGAIMASGPISLQELCPYLDEIGDAYHEIDRLTEQNKSMREALEWYADLFVRTSDGFNRKETHYGERARKALEAVK